jgi:hypothetical protein
MKIRRIIDQGYSLITVERKHENSGLVYLTLMSPSVGGDDHYEPAESCSLTLSFDLVRELIKALEEAIAEPVP